jgi:hypothetical protein
VSDAALVRFGRICWPQIAHLDLVGRGLAAMREALAHVKPTLALLVQLERLPFLKLGDSGRAYIEGQRPRRVGNPSVRSRHKALAWTCMRAATAVLQEFGLHALGGELIHSYRPAEEAR